MYDREYHRKLECPKNRLVELSSLKLNFSFKKIGHIKKLKEVISHDNFRGERGIFLTLIHKFRENFLPEELFSNFQNDKQKVNFISQRKNIVCFLDEVHRSQYGLLAGQMKNVFKNALGTFLSREALVEIKGSTRVGKSGIFITVPFTYTAMEKFSMF